MCWYLSIIELKNSRRNIENEVSGFLQNNVTVLRDYTASYPRR